MEEGLVLLFEVLPLLIAHWRAAVPPLIAIPIAVVLTVTRPWFTGWDCILLMIFSVGGGLLWELSAKATTPQAPAASRFASRLGAARSNGAARRGQRGTP